jgi:hypothetical protein
MDQVYILEIAQPGVWDGYAAYTDTAKGNNRFSGLMT